MGITPVFSEDIQMTTFITLLAVTVALAAIILFIICHYDSIWSRFSREKKKSLKNLWGFTFERPVCVPVGPMPQYPPGPPVYPEPVDNGQLVSANSRRSRNRRAPAFAAPPVTHSWMNVALRGHTNNVLDFNVSSRYIGSCAPEISPYLSQTRHLFTMPIEDLHACVSRHILKDEDFSDRGFPVEICSMPCARNIIYPGNPRFKKSVQYYEEQKDDSGFCSNKSNDSSTTSSDYSDDEKMPESERIRRECVRCYKSFYIDAKTHDYLNPKICMYHHGRLFNKWGTHGIYYYWTCCKGSEDSAGCTKAKMHVWSDFEISILGVKFVRTQPCRTYEDKFGIYALDCEMCYTKNGLELAKITLVDVYGHIVYHRYVKTTGEIIDYNSTYSGITEQLYLSQKTIPLEQVQNELRTFVFDETILIGHNLASDFKALRLYHNNVVDTTKIFPHETEKFPFCKSLKTLAKRLLKRDIQINVHDSIEDARAVMDLVLLQVSYDMKS